MLVLVDEAVEARAGERAGERGRLLGEVDGDRAQRTVGGRDKRSSNEREEEDEEEMFEEEVADEEVDEEDDDEVAVGGIGAKMTGMTALPRKVRLSLSSS